MEDIGEFEFWFVMFTGIIAPLICILLFYVIHYYDILSEYIVNKNCVFLLVVMDVKLNLKHYKIFKDTKAIEDYLTSLNREYFIIDPNISILSDLSEYKMEKYDLQLLYEHFKSNTRIRLWTNQHTYTIFKEKLT